MDFCLRDKRDIIIERYLFPWLSVLSMGIPNLPGWCNSYAIASSHSMEWGDGIIGHGSEWSHWDVSHGCELAGQHLRNTLMAGPASLLFSLRTAAQQGSCANHIRSWLWIFIFFSCRTRDLSFNINIRSYFN